MTAVIAGAAFRTPLGASVERVVSRLLAGEHAARPHPAGALCCPIAEQPPASRHDRFLDTLGLLALDAAREALANAGDQGRLERTGLFAATSGLRPRWTDMVGALAGQRDDQAGLWDRGLARLHPFWMLQHLTNNVHALCSIDLRIRGEGATFAGAAAGAEALCAAVRALDAGAVDAALVVAWDSLLEPQCMADLSARSVATSAGPSGWRPPYDEDARGFVPGEAAAAVVLVRPDDGHRALLCCAAGVDPKPLPSGEPRPERVADLARLVARADAVVDGLGAGQPELDFVEREAVGALCAPGARLIATAASFGRLGAPTPLVQAIAAVELLRRGMLPPVAALRRAAAGPLPPVVAPLATLATSALLLSGCAPGLAGAVRVEVR